MTTPAKKTAAKKTTGRRKTAAKPDPLKVIAAAKLPERTVELCLRGDLVAEVEDLERQVHAAAEAKPERLVGNAGARKLAERIEDLREEMRASSIVFKLRAMTHLEFRDFLATHGPREGDQRDQRAGVNLETYHTDLARRCLVEPVLDDDAWQQLLGALSAKQWDELAGTADALNNDRITVPFSYAASLIHGSDAK